MIVGTEPIFTVTDVQRAVEHYQRLGFSTSFHDETYAFAHRDDLTIHLAHRDDPASEGTAALYLHVDDAEELAAEWRRAGVQVAGPEDFDYGKREGWHVDPDGNKIRFGSPLPQPGQGEPAHGQAEETATASNIAVVLGAVADAVRSQDSTPLAALLDEHVVWEGVSADQRCEGQHQAMHIISGFFARNRLAFDAVEVGARGEMIVVGMRGPGFNGIPGDTTTPGQLFHVMTLHNGVVRRWKSYLDRDEAYAAAEADTPSGAPAR
jgi:catechol 2,3-dioxygenase-like lactoylglutathione lyase family enzyme